MELIALSFMGSFALFVGYGLMVVRQQLGTKYRHIFPAPVFNSPA